MPRKDTMTQQTEALEAALPSAAAPRPAWSWVAIRNLGPQHAARLVTHLQALSEADRLLRFGLVATDEQIEAYVGHIDFERDLVFGIFNRRLQLVAMAHLAFGAADDPSHAAAEFGVSVLERVRGRGLGGRLFDHAVMHARNRGIKTMLIHVARGNSAMLAIVRRAGAEVQFDGAEAVGRLLLPPDTLGSQIEELVGHQAAELDYHIKMHLLRLDNLRPRGPAP
jgi:GNAT superfamily N-acetyltransferase